MKTIQVLKSSALLLSAGMANATETVDLSALESFIDAVVPLMYKLIPLIVVGVVILVVKKWGHSIGGMLGGVLGGKN